jgi:uncharacterized protein
MLSVKTNDTVFQNIKILVCDKLKGLDPSLTYHNIEHTLDVLTQSERIAREEGVDDENELFLLKVAALYHDTGFLRTYAKHEEISCKIFLEDAELFHFTEEDKRLITRLIMTTKLPQLPTNLLEKVICDADLDYLGREDFFSIGDGLRREFLKFGIIKSDEEWHRLQEKFLTSHHYHTTASQTLREIPKQANIAKLL